MEVSLEKVQYKFASIIGELCSQPVILSQFAVWLDLRLAEYKAKGAISLDCSGDKPDPVWLNGLKSPHPFSNAPFEPCQSRLAADRSRTKSPRSRSRNFDNGRNLPNTSDVLHVTDSFSDNHTDIQQAELRDSSPEVIIKDEPADDRLGIFPTGLHGHENRDGAAVSNESERRKRRSVNESGMSQSQSGDIESIGSFSTHTPAKVRKTGDSLYTVQESSNQSLMSIIGVQDFSQEATPVSLDDVQRDIDLVMAVQMQENQERMGENSLQSSVIPGRSLGRPSSTVTRGDQGDASQANAAGARSDDAQPHLKCVLTSTNRPSPGFCTPQDVEKFGMLELVKGTGVYLHKEMHKTALNRCKGNLSPSNGVHLLDGKPAARYLLSVFFKQDELIYGSMSTCRILRAADGTQLSALDPHILNAIMSFCVENSDSPRRQIKEAMQCKITSMRCKMKKHGKMH